MKKNMFFLEKIALQFSKKWYKNTSAGGQKPDCPHTETKWLDQDGFR